MKERRLFLILVIAAVPAFAQQDWKYDRQMAITLNPAPLVLGTIFDGFGASAGFEYAFTRQFAAKTQLYFMGFDPVMMFHAKKAVPSASFSFSLEGRWYPAANRIHGLFANSGVQFQWLLGSFTINQYEMGHLENSTRFNNNNTIGIFAGAGYKKIFGKNRFGFAIEPTFDYIWSVRPGTQLLNTGSSTLPVYWALGIQGVRFAVHLGAAF